MSGSSLEMVERFRDTVAELDLPTASDKLADTNVEAELHTWLDGGADPLPWTYLDRVTADEWFFITTLYGEMTLDGQRTHIRKYFPTLFVQAVSRDIRGFVPGMAAYDGLRSRWMSQRLCRMREVLRERSCIMTDYVDHLRQVERTATPDNPTPALDTIIRDHRAGGWKTLSVFVRDCVGGNSFPIDSRVERELNRRRLPINERQLVSLSLVIGRNPRPLARLFFEAGGH